MFAVDGFVPFVGSMTYAERAEGGEALEGFIDVGGHGEVDMAVGAIAPVERQSQEFGACAVDCCCVETVDGGEEVIEIGGVDIFDAKVVDDEGELDGVCCVTPEGRSAFEGW